MSSLKKHRGRSYLPYAFTEQGVAMLSSVLRSQRAVEVNIAIMRAFVQLRRLGDSNRDLSRKIGEMEKKYDGQFRMVRAMPWAGMGRTVGAEMRRTAGAENHPLDLHFHDTVAPHLAAYDLAASETQQRNFLTHLHTTLNAPSHPIRNRLLRLTADRPDLLAIIKAEGRV